LRVFEEMIDIRRAYQEPLLPVVEEKFKKIDARIKLRLEQRNSLAIKLKNMLIAPRPEYLATADERIAMERISVLEEYIKAHPRDVGEEFIQRVKRLRGVILWSIQSDYDQRLTDAYNHLIDLDELIKELNTRYQSFIRTRQAATQSYDGYSIPIRQFRTRLFDAQRKLKGVMAKQGRVLETMAINELDQRRKRLEEYQIKARFALAESYDRATKAQLDEEIEKQRKLHESRQTENVNQTVNQQEESQAENASQQVNDSEQATKEQNTVADEPAAVDEAATQDASEASSSNEDSSADR